MKKLLLFTLLLLGGITINAQVTIALLDEYVDPFNYWLNSGYIDYGQRNLWNVFKPDSIHTNEGGIKFNYSESHQISSIEYNMTTTSYLYTKGNYTYYYDYDKNDRLIGNGTNFWQYLEDDNFSNDSISNGKRLQIPIYFDMYGSKNEDKMIELIYDSSEKIKQYTVYENQNSVGEWIIENTYYYIYNNMGEIQEINAYTSKGILNERYYNFEWEDFLSRKISSLFYTKFKTSETYEYKVEYTWNGDSFSMLQSDYYSDAWHNYSRYSKSVTDTYYLINNDNYNIIYNYIDAKGNAAGYLEYYNSNFNSGTLWVTKYNSEGIAISTTYNTINSDSVISSSATDYYYYGLNSEDGNQNEGDIENSIETHEKNQFKVYPTLTNSEVTITNPTKNTIVKVFNNTGQLIKQTTIEAGNITMNLSDLKAGLYYVVINNTQYNETHKIIKQ